MTLTTLEHLELTDVDVPIECDSGICSAVAIFAVTTFCCPRLLCASCTTDFKDWAAQYTPGEAMCFRHPGACKFCTTASDLIVSVQPL